MNVKLYIFCGIPFSGKSTLSKEVSKRKGYTRIDLDEVKFELYGEDVRDTDLVQSDWDAIYQVMYERIRSALKANKTVLHDTGNFTKHERSLVKDIADKEGIESITVFVDTPIRLAKERLLANKKSKTRFDITDQEFQDAVNEMEAPDQTEVHFVYQSGESVDDWIAKHFI